MKLYLQCTCVVRLMNEILQKATREQQINRNHQQPVTRDESVSMKAEKKQPTTQQRKRNHESCGKKRQTDTMVSY